jgi:hypothetical protein
MDITYVAMGIYVCYKCIFQMFQLFHLDVVYVAVAIAYVPNISPVQTYVASVLS